jgi:phosphotransferase system enzyme I (PtsI)
MTARSLAAVGSVLRSVTLTEAQELPALALNAPTAAEGRDAVRDRLPILAGLGL